VSHDKLGAADHSSVDQDALFEPILSNWGLSPIGYILLVYSIYSTKLVVNVITIKCIFLIVKKVNGQ